MTPFAGGAPVLLGGMNESSPFMLVDFDDLALALTVAWRLDAGRGYAIGNLPMVAGVARTIRAHRWLIDAPAGVTVDHINGDKLDNRRANLRLCTQAENTRNRVGLAGSSSRFKGVAWHAARGKWVAGITHQGKRTYLGLYRDEVAAALAYDVAALQLFGEFARPNFPQGVTP